MECETDLGIEFEFLGDQRLGVVRYTNAFSNGQEIIDSLERTIGLSSEQPFCWSDALVGFSEKMPGYRDCVDFKINEQYLESVPEDILEVKDTFLATKKTIRKCVSHYESMYNISMAYMEAINYVKYISGHHFAVHSDHGFSYRCTLSSIMYLNDGYEGGELWFPYLDIKYVPKRGEIILFPSTFIYAHASLPVISGTKYVAVTMFDWNDRLHK
jgi:hypothetical protein